MYQRERREREREREKGGKRKVEGVTERERGERRAERSKTAKGGRNKEGKENRKQTRKSSIMLMNRVRKWNAGKKYIVYFCCTKVKEERER